MMDLGEIIHSFECHRCKRPIDEPASPMNAACITATSPCMGGNGEMSALLCGACFIDLLAFMEPKATSEPEAVAMFDQIRAHQREYAEHHHHSD